MSDAALPRPDRAAPILLTGPIGWLRANLFSSPLNSAVTLLVGYFLAKWLFGFVEWGVINAVWSVPGNQTQACRALQGTGACWAVITEKHRFILFGTYLYDEQWRPLLAILIFIALFRQKQ